MNNKTINILGIILVSFLVQNLNAQTTEQMRIWAFNGVEVDFTGSTVTTQTISTPISNANGAYASYYDENDDLVLRVVDNNVYDENNDIVDQLFDLPSSNFFITNQMVISPTEQFGACEYNIFYIVITNGNQVDVRYATYSSYLKQIVDEHEIWSYPYSSNSYANWNLALSDFIGSTDVQRLYLVLTSHIDGSKTNDSIKIAYFEGPTFRMTSINTFAHGSHINTIGEVELSSDLSFLAYTSPYNTSEDLNIIPINVSTGMFSGTIAHLDITPGATGMFVGLECSADNNFVYTNNAGGSIYKIDVSNPSSPYVVTSFSLIGQQVDYTNSQIERGHDGYFYMVKSDGYLGYFTTNFNGITDYANIGSSAVINNSIVANDPDYPFDMYLIPDQIDGCEYEYTNGDEVVCCYAYNESPIKNPEMTGVSHNYTTGDITITSGSTVSWTQTSNPFTSGGQAITEIYLKGSLQIAQGARLNITGLTLHFKEDELLLMNSSTSSSVTGPKLYLYSGSKLTVFDECDEDALWTGIDCNGGWGTGYAQSGVSVLRQPLVYVSSSTIEFAEKGIDVSGGGIVYGLNSNFKDNIIDIKFSSWNYDNVSYFTYCDFYTTSELYNKGYNPSNHVHLWNAPGLLFSACDFRNDYASSVSISQRGVGILSTGSSITVKEKCSVPQQLGYPCPSQYTNRGSFTDLYYGIKIDAGSFYNLSRIDFNNCVKAAWLIACDAITVTECDFDVSSETLSGSLLYDSFGLYIESSTGYHIEGNEFHDGVLGMVVYNSEIDNNEVYHNDFYNLTGNGVATGAIGLGLNGIVSDSPSGLQFKCNDFNLTDYAIAVTGGSLQTLESGQIDVIWSSISWKQGQNVITGNFESARNTFWLHGQTNENDFYVDYSKSYIHVTGGTYNYYGSTDILIDRDANINSYNPSEVSRNYIGFFTTREQECPQTIYSYGGIIIPLMETIGGFNDEEQELENQIEELMSYNELELLISAQTANVNNISSVYNSLNEASPNLTSEILLAYLNNTNVSELSRTSLMLSNSPLPKDVVEAIENSDISENYKSYILKSQNGENQIEQKLNRISGLKSARQVSYDKLVRATFDADTTSDFSNTYDMILGFMETQTDLHAKEKLTDLYIHKGLFDNALSVLCDIENIAENTEDESLLNSVKVKEIKIDLLRTHSIEEAQNVIQNNAEYLKELASDYNTKEGGVARAILESAGLWDNFPIVFLPNPEGEISTKSTFIETQEEDKPIVNYELESLFKLYPNPANDYLSVEFINPNGNCTFNIYSIKGELLKTITSNQQIGFISIDISNLSTGNYIINCPELQSKINFIVAR